MNRDWSVEIFILALIIFGVLSIASLVRDFKMTMSALAGCFIYWTASLLLLIAIAFDKPRRLLPAYIGKVLRSSGALLRELQQTVVWLAKLVWKPLSARTRKKVKKAKPADLGHETPGGIL